MGVAILVFTFQRFQTPGPQAPIIIFYVFILAAQSINDLDLRRSCTVSVDNAALDTEGELLVYDSTLSIIMATENVLFRWSGGGKEVHLCGTFNDWGKIPMTKRFAYYDI